MDEKTKNRSSKEPLKPTKSSRKRLKLDTDEVDPRKILKRKIKELEIEVAGLDEDIAKLKSKGVSTDLKPEMQALHDYNDMKDMTQMVLGYLANVEQSTLGELHKRYNLPRD